MKTYDFIGIGIGPFNLSIAALAEGLDGFSSLFLERKPHFSRHPGMMVPDCHMQTSFLKDLVSAVEPTNRHSFLNYLVQRKSSTVSSLPSSAPSRARSLPTTCAGRRIT